MTDKTPSAADFLQLSAEIYRERNKLYGNSYHNHGLVMTALFPSGIELKTVSDFNRFGVLNMMVSKLSRYTENFAKGGHPDSSHDLTTYTAMLSELDALVVPEPDVKPSPILPEWAE